MQILDIKYFHYAAMASIFIPESCQRTWEGDAILYCRGASSQSKHGKKTFAELGAKQETFSSWKRKGSILYSFL